MKKFFLLLPALLPAALFATTWQVGPTKTYTYCSQVASLVQPGDTVTIDYATYVNDPQVIWSVDNLVIKGVGGRPTLQAGALIANDMVNGKGIFVISGHNVRVENIAFTNCTVQDHNGAGIRQEGRNLHVTGCKFDGNEMGILAGNITNCSTLVEYSEFLNGGSVANPGYQHNIYINHIDTLIFRYNYSHNAIAEGHELKSRATNNLILYNRIANETTVDSRTIDLPNGGRALVMGNVIEQGPTSANSNLLGYGLEGLSNAAPHALYVVNNTFVNKKTTGSFVHVQNATDTLLVKNNIFAGAKTGGLFIGTASVVDSAKNLINDTLSVFGFINPNSYDYHLQTNSIAKDAGQSLTKWVLGLPLNPVSMYKDSCQTEIRPMAGVLDIGAFELPFPAGIHAIAETKNFVVYPNPAADYVRVAQGVGHAYTMYTLSGQALQQGVLTAQGVDLRMLSTGWYVLRVEGVSMKFYKE